MKRRYKPGDWLRVPLGGEQDALAIIARGCRSRLFGYFFAYPADREPTHEELRALRGQTALAVLLFGGSPIERGRWQLIATSLAFDERAWPFPEFVSRGAFGEAWTRVRYDPQTLQIIERTPGDAQDAKALPDARFADASEVEDTLRRRLAGTAVPPAHSVCEVRSPLDPKRLLALEQGGTIQFSTPLDAADLQHMSAFIAAHPHVRLRVHGFRRGFDARALCAFSTLRHLTLDVRELQHSQALEDLRSLQTLRLGAMQTDLRFLDALSQLRRLELRGTRAQIAPVERCTGLSALVLENTPSPDFSRLSSAQTLASLTLAHGEYDLHELHSLTQVRQLELRALDITQLPEFAALPRLEYLALRDLRGVHDLSRLARARSLHELQIAGMPHLNVSDFAPLAGWEALQDLRIDVGSRRKEREIYRLIRCGNR